MKEIIFSTPASWAGFVLRITAGLTMFPHGAQKLLGWFGGYGFSGTMWFFTGTMHLPWIVGFLVILIEFFGALLLLIGLGSRIVSGTFIILLLGIVFSSHLQNGFFMNWGGQQPGEGIEFFLLFLGICITLLIVGGGRYSVDRKLTEPR